MSPNGFPSLPPVPVRRVRCNLNICHSHPLLSPDTELRSRTDQAAELFSLRSQSQLDEFCSICKVPIKLIEGLLHWPPMDWKNYPNRLCSEKTKLCGLCHSAISVLTCWPHGNWLHQSPRRRRRMATEEQISYKVRETFTLATVVTLAARLHRLCGGWEENRTQTEWKSVILSE